MTSNLLSRFIPKNPAGRSIYEDLRAADHGSDSDMEERAGMAIDEENLEAEFHGHDLENTELFNDEASRMNSESTAFLAHDQRSRPSRKQTDTERGAHFTRSPRMLDDDGDDDVPMSLLIEGNGHNKPVNRSRPSDPFHSKPLPIPGPSNRETRARWDSVQAHQPLYSAENARIPDYRAPSLAQTGNFPISRQDKALWMWVNVQNLDAFTNELYDYYVGSGIWCILLAKVFQLGILVFMAGFITFLTSCVEYNQVRYYDRLSDILVPKCTQKIGGFGNVLLWLFAAFVLFKAFDSLACMPRLWRMHDFYLYCLQIPDSDMQTISWPTVVSRLMALRDANPITSTQKLSPSQRKWLHSQSKERMTAHDIANRLMRRENYLIALFNKEILDFTLPMPFLRNTQLFSHTLEWSINYCILDLVFGKNNQVLPMVLKDSHRRELSDALRRRFVFAGIMSLICVPFILSYVLLVYFFQYFNEYQKNPSALGARQYTPYAEWKFREFNEVHHLFHERLNMSYPFATRYINQFPKKKTTQFAKFTSFIAGAIIAVLGLATLLDPEMFLGFQITRDRTVLFYLGIFGAIWALARGSIPDENQVFDPEYSLSAVINYTHYSPPHWTGRLHTDEVKREFSTLYQMRIVVFAMELLGILFTPVVLLNTLPQASDRIIDFFREFTVHLDGLGYVCSFAVFDFKNGAGRAEKRFNDNAPDGAEGGDNLRDEYYSTQHGKMAASYFNFIDNYHINPQTGIPGHIPHSFKRQFHPPPSFPGLQSPTLAADMQSSRYNRKASRVPAGSRTPRFPSIASPSPMTSMMLDQHNQSSASARGARRNTRSQYRSTRNIRQETIEDEEEGGEQDVTMRETRAFGSSGLEESVWETSPTRNPSSMAEESGQADGQVPQAAGVLGLLYQFQKAHTEGMKGPGGVNF